MKGKRRSTPQIIKLLKSRKRMIIAFDKEGVHFRETLYVTHDGLSGEARYDTKPIGSVGAVRQLRRALAYFVAATP